MTADPTRATDRDQHEYALRAKLNRLLLVRHELWDECQPIPPALEQVIREVRQALGLKPPAELEWPPRTATERRTPAATRTAATPDGPRPAPA